MEQFLWTNKYSCAYASCLCLNLDSLSGALSIITIGLAKCSIPDSF